MPSTALLWMCLKPLGNRPPMSLGSMRYLAVSLGANITSPAAGYTTSEVPTTTKTSAWLISSAVSSILSRLSPNLR